MANKIRNKEKLFTVPAFPQPPAEYSSSYIFNKDLVLRLYLQGVDEALKSALQYDSDDIIDGSIPDSKLEARYLRKDQNDTTEYTLTVGGLVVDTDTLYVDAVNNRVGILTTTPSEALDVVGNVQATEFIGDLRGAVVFKAKAGEDLTKGDVVYISGISGNTTVVSKADANDSAKMPAFGLAAITVSNNASLEVYTFGTLSGIDTSSYSEGDELFVSDTAGQLTATAPTGESSAVQKIAKVTRSHASAGSVKVMGAGRTNATPNLNNGNIFMGDASNIATTVSFDTKVGDYITANPITNAQLAGSIENAKLSNSTVSYGGVQLSLGGADATPAFDLSDATNYPAGSLTGEIGTAQIADDAVTNAKLADNSVGTSQLGDLTVTTAKIPDSAITSAKIANGTITTADIAIATIRSLNMDNDSIYTAAIQDDAVTSAKITGPFSSKHAFSTTATQTISTTSAVTIYEPDIPAPPGGNEATQSINAVIRVRFYNSSSSSVKENHQWKMNVAIKSKTNVGTSLGTATYSSSPSTYNAWYYVSGDKTSMFASSRGGLGTSSTGANLGSFVGVYYDSANDRTYFRVSKFPDATTIYNGVEVFYSTVNFSSSGTFVNDIGFNNQYLTIGSTTAYQTVDVPLVFSLGRSTTATEVRIQFDHVSSTTNLSTVITSINGYVENTV